MVLLESSLVEFYTYSIGAQSGQLPFSSVLWKYSVLSGDLVTFLGGVKSDLSTPMVAELQCLLTEAEALTFDCADVIGEDMWHSCFFGLPR